MRAGKNLLMGMAGSIWNALLNLAVVPIYLRYLGVDAYGLVGVLVTLQFLFQILDLGIAPTVNREVARGTALGNLATARTLVHSLAFVYWGTALFIAIIVSALSGLLSEYWVHSDKLPPSTIRLALMLMGAVIAGRWPVGLYLAAVSGAHRLASGSLVTMLYSTVNALGAIAILAFVSKTIQALFIWQALTAILYAIGMRWLAWRVLGGTGTTSFEVASLRRIWRFSAGMFAVTVAGALFTQIDKMILSRMLGLADFGIYTLAGTIAGALGLFTTPVFNVIYPNFAALVAAGQPEKLRRNYRIASRMTSAVLFSTAIVLAVLSKNVIALWTGNPAIAAKAAPIVSLLVFGTALNGVLTVTHALQLAYGMTKLPLVINAVLLVVAMPAIISLVYFYAGPGGAAAWLFLNVLYGILSLLLTHLTILKTFNAMLAFWDIVAPALVASAAGVAVYAANALFHMPDAVAVVFGALIGILAIIASVLSYAPARETVAINRRNIIGYSL